MTPRKIVIRGPNWLGDAVLGVPAMKAVRERFPEATITLLIRNSVAGLFNSAPYIDELWTRPGTTNWIQTAREMRRRRFDLALLLPNSFESALTVFLGGVRYRVGYATDARGWLLNRSVQLPPGKPHQLDYYLNLVDAAFGPGTHPDVEITPTEEELVSARKLLINAGVDPSAKFLVVNPGAAFGSAKRWFEQRFAAVADRLAEEMNFQVLMIGSAGERLISENIQKLMKMPSHVLSGQTNLETLIGLLAQASVMVTNDSGPMHMAAALGVPTVAVFGPTDADVTSPVGPYTRLIRHDVECNPCLLRECPIDHRCMDRVTIDEVFDAVGELLQIRRTSLK